MTKRICNLLTNIVKHPWTCEIESDPYLMDEQIQKLIDDAFAAEGIEDNIYFEATSFPFIDGEHVLYKSKLRIVCNEPRIVLGDIENIRTNRNEMRVDLTDKFGDHTSFKSIIFYLRNDNVEEI